MNTDIEYAAKVDLAACYRLMVKYGMTDIIYNHITAQVPGNEKLFFINGLGLHYSEVCASNLYTVDLEGNIVQKPDLPFGISRAGYVIHSAIHAARHDVRCIIHTHTRAGMAVSSLKEGLLPLTQTAMRFYERIGYHDYEGPAVDKDEQERLVADLGSHNAMILRNHGLLTCGATVAEAFNLMLWLETACKAQVDTLAMGREIVVPDEVVLNRTARLYDPDVRQFGLLEWDAMLRLLDREDSSYRS